MFLPSRIGIISLRSMIAMASSAFSSESRCATSTVSRGGRRCAGSAGTTASRLTAVQRNWRTALIMGTFRELECEWNASTATRKALQSATAAVDNTMTSFHYAPEAVFVHRAVLLPSSFSANAGIHCSPAAATIFPPIPGRVLLRARRIEEVHRPRLERVLCTHDRELAILNQLLDERRRMS